MSHSLITNTFEFSLQRVNPKLTVPYWDFTIETTAAANLAYDQQRPLTRTELLSPSWFGSVDLEDHMVRGLVSDFLRRVFYLVLVALLVLRCRRFRCCYPGSRRQQWWRPAPRLVRGSGNAAIHIAEIPIQVGVSCEADIWRVSMYHPTNDVVGNVWTSKRMKHLMC